MCFGPLVFDQFIRGSMSDCLVKFDAMSWAASGYHPAIVVGFDPAGSSGLATEMGIYSGASLVFNIRAIPRFNDSLDGWLTEGLSVRCFSHDWKFKNQWHSITVLFGQGRSCRATLSFTSRGKNPPFLLDSIPSSAAQIFCHKRTFDMFIAFAPHATCFLVFAHLHLIWAASWNRIWI